MRSKFQLHIYARDGFKNVSNHIFMSFSSILTLIITLSLCAIVVLFVVNASSFTVDIESQVTLMMEMVDEATDEQINDIQNLLSRHPLVESWTFIDRSTGHADILDVVAGGDTDIIDLFAEAPNRVVDVFDVFAINIESLNELHNELYEHPYIQFVYHPEEAASRISDTTTMIRDIMTFFAAVLMLLAIFLIHNTIKITIYSRKDELSIMRLVGASVGHITFPFLIEGLIIGVIGAIFPILFILVGYRLLYDFSGGMFAIYIFQLVDPTPLVYQIGFTMGIISISVSLLGSLVAVGRHAFKD